MARTFWLEAQFVFFQALILFAKATEQNVNDPKSCPGDGWVPYSDEKCFKLIQEYTSFSKAETLCKHIESQHGSYSSLATIQSADEQEFLANWIFTQNNVQVNVWLGAKRNADSEFQWLNGNFLKDGYANWGPSSPSNVAGKNCVEMQSQFTRKLNGFDSKQAGLWHDVTCQAGNYVVCQKQQTWSFSKLQQTLLETRKNLQDKLDVAMNDLDVTKNDLAATQKDLAASKHDYQQQVDQLRSNPVPVGFIYVQLPNEQSPTDVWGSGLTWTDVSANYAGLFLRISGGNAASFGVTQDENTPRISAVETGWNNHMGLDDSNYCYSDNSLPFGQQKPCRDGVPIGGQSRWLLTGHYNGNDPRRIIRLVSSGGEVRPRNTAVKVWKRIG